jgi:hypothetical protein
MYDVSGGRRGFWYDVILRPGAAFITPAKLQLRRNSSSYWCHWFSANGITIEMFHVAQFCKVMKSRLFRIQMNLFLKWFIITRTAGHSCWLSRYTHIRLDPKIITKSMWTRKEQTIWRRNWNSDYYLAVPDTYRPKHFLPDVAFILVKWASELQPYKTEHSHPSAMYMQLRNVIMYCVEQECLVLSVVPSP